MGGTEPPPTTAMHVGPDPTEQSCYQPPKFIFDRVSSGLGRGKVARHWSCGVRDVGVMMDWPRYSVREVVGVFPTVSALESAIQQLGIAGVNRAAISVL